LETIIITLSLTAAGLIITGVLGMIKTINFVADRPKREEVATMIETQLQAVNVKIDHVASDVKFIRETLEKKTTRK
jgi:hypothetical protein